MSGTIKIIKGSEYQIRAMNKIDTEDIFVPAYKRAIEIVHEICREEELKKDNAGARVHNIVVFSSGRGQGKTSALCTFSRFLADYNNQKKLLDIVDEKMYRFYVLPHMIDPAALKSGESVTGIFLSRLYADFKSRIDRYVSLGIGRLDHNKIDDIRMLFSRCLRNVRNVDGTSRHVGEFDEDELDILFGTGDGGDLRNHIEELIDKYLKFVADLDNSDSGSDKRYLVVKIDDADLAMGKTYQVCEDVRNYLCVNKLIILMAADFRQMEYAVEQEYMQQYSIMLNSQTEMVREQFIHECHRMASKYLEKSFPEGHRLFLPKIEELLLENRNGVRLSYIDDSGKEPYDILEGIVNNHSVQEQLSAFLYSRTGIVLVPKNGGRHYFMPRTFRELSHFLKLVGDLHNIEDIAKAFSGKPGTKDETGQKDRLIIVENIRSVRRYFCEYWCQSHLREEYERVIWDLCELVPWDSEFQNDIVRRLEDYRLNVNNKTDIKNNGDSSEGYCHHYRKAFANIAKDYEGTRHGNLFINALKMYFTLQLNMWAAYGWDKPEEMAALGRFIRHSFPISDKTFRAGIVFTSDEDDQINPMKFDIPDVDDMESLDGWNQWNHRCMEEDDQTKVNYYDIFKNVFIHPDYALEIISTDVPVPMDIGDFNDITVGSNSIQANLQLANKTNIYAAIKELLVNSDVQDLCETAIEKFTKEKTKVDLDEKKIFSLEGYYSKFCVALKNACKNSPGVLSKVDPFEGYLKRVILDRNIYRTLFVKRLKDISNLCKDYKALRDELEPSDEIIIETDIPEKQTNGVEHNDPEIKESKVKLQKKQI